MAFKKGDPKPPGSGRKKGTPNKVTAAVKDFLAELLDDPQVRARLRQATLEGDTRAFIPAVEHVIGRPKKSVEQSIVGPMEIRLFCCFRGSGTRVGSAPGRAGAGYGGYRPRPLSCRNLVSARWPNGRREGD